MFSVLASHDVDRGFKPRSWQTKDCYIGICCFSAQYATLMSKSKDWLLVLIMCPSAVACLPTDSINFVSISLYNENATKLMQKAMLYSAYI